MKLLCIFVLIVAVYKGHAITRRLCGPVLTQVMQSVCTNGYNSIKTKRSVPLHTQLNVLDNYNDIENVAAVKTKSSFLDDLLMGNHVNTFSKIIRRRNLLGIYYECCVEGCEVNELNSYCI